MVHVDDLGGVLAGAGMFPPRPGCFRDGEDAAGATGARERPGNIRTAEEAPARGGTIREGGLDAQGQPTQAARVEQQTLR